MIGRQRSGVFLSYAREDGEAFAATLRERLHAQAPDIEVKQDRLLLEGGVGWWKQLTDAIDSVEFLVLVMTPSSMRSETVRKEWRYARQAGVCLYSVKGAPDVDLQLSNLPRWMSKAHFFDLDKEWESFVAHVRKGCDAPRVPFMAPDLPENFVERPEEFGRLKSLLLSTDRKGPVAITTALSGAGGFGKTTLAIALCHDEDIVQNFDDGILWVTLGQNPNVMSALVTAYAALTGERPGFASEEDAAFQLGQKLEDRTCLLVIDDVWDESHLRPFLRGGNAGARLFTTRNAEIASSKARPVKVDEMSGTQSQALLAKGVPGLNSVQAQQLSQRLGEWPIALELASAMMRQRIEQGDSAEHAAQRLLYTLDKKGARGLVKSTGSHRNIDSVLQGSLELLSDEDRAHLIELSIFPEDVAIPLTAAAVLWGLDEFESEDLAQRFARLYLLKLDLSRGSMRLHDVLRSWLVAAASNAAALHSRLVDGWSDWHRLRDVYAWRWLTWHLAQAGRKTDIEKLLWDPAWLQAKLAAADINALIADFEYLKPSREAELIQGALRLSSHVLAKDPSQFGSQMTGRLLSHANHEKIQSFIDSTGQTADRPWLRPLWPTLDPPGTALLRTLAGHSSLVNGVTVTTNGSLAVSASDDNTLKVWHLEDGRELRTLEGHSREVYGVAIVPDGRRAVSASRDKMLKVWDLESGCELRTLEGHSGAVNSVAIAPDGRRAVSAARDNTLKVWDLEAGRILLTLEGHSNCVNSVAIAADGQHAVSASSDRTLKVWDLESGRELRSLKGHSGEVYGVAIAPDGRLAVSASRDKMLKVWNLESGLELRSLEGHCGGLTGVAITPDGRRAVSASFDKSLKVWDLESGRELHSFEGHSGGVKGVAIAPDGRRAVSASRDKTLKVWDLESGNELRSLEGHSSWVRSMAVTPDGWCAVSASRDKTLKIWDLKAGRQLGSLEGHLDEVSCVAITPDGRSAVSASWDKTLKVWDLETVCELRTLAGHSDRVNGVAIAPDGRRVVSASRDRTLKVWDLESGCKLRTLQGHNSEVHSVAITPDGRRAVSASRDKTIKVWDLENGHLLGSFEGHSDRVRSVTVTPDGRYAVSASDDKTLKLWDLDSGGEPRTIEGHSALVNNVAVTPDGRRAVSASWDRTLMVSDLASGAKVAAFTCDAAVTFCALADDRRILAGDYSGRLHLLALEFPQPR